VDCQSTESSGLEDFNEQVWQVLSERGHLARMPLLATRNSSASD